MAELVEHHIEEEEDDMLKTVEQDIDLRTRQSVGALYTQIKDELDALNQPRVHRTQFAAVHRMN